MLTTKFRPHSWMDVVGQEPIVSTLSRQIAMGTWKHAYLFTGAHGCVDKDTEYFNGTEWKKISDYREGDYVLQYNPDTEYAELVNPSAYIKLPCEKMYHVKSKYGVDMCLSDEHRVIYKTRSGRIAEIEFKDLKERLDRGTDCSKSYKFITTFKYSGKGIELTDDEIRIMCAVICDGSFPKNATTNRCIVNLKKEYKIEELRFLLRESNIGFKEYYCVSNGYTRFTFNAPRKEKEFTDYWYNCNAHQLSVICDNVILWDGSIDSKGKKKFSQRSKKSIDFLQFAFASIGKRTSIRVDDRRGSIKRVNNKDYVDKNVTYEMYITDRNLVGLPRIKHYTEIVPEDGYKYCFTVPSHMWIMRRNGHIMITGNCGKTSAARIFFNELNHGEGTAIEIDAASNSGVDNIRAIIADAQQSSIDCDYKLYIIDEAHQLSKAAWDASLKLIEEPPSHCVFIFCTTDPDKIPATILSRVQRFDFRRVPSKVIADRLEYIMIEESHTEYERRALDRIAQLADGHVRDAVQYLENCLDVSDNITLDVVESTLGLVKYDSLMTLCRGMFSQNISMCMDEFDKIKSYETDLSRVYDSLTDIVVSLAIYAQSQNITYTDISEEYRDVLELARANPSKAYAIVLAMIDRKRFLSPSNAEVLLKTTFVEFCA